MHTALFLGGLFLYISINYSDILKNPVSTSSVYASVEQGKEGGIVKKAILYCAPVYGRPFVICGVWRGYIHIPPPPSNMPPRVVPSPWSSIVHGLSLPTATASTYT